MKIYSGGEITGIIILGILLLSFTIACCILLFYRRNVDVSWKPANSNKNLLLNWLYKNDFRKRMGNGANWNSSGNSLTVKGQLVAMWMGAGGILSLIGLITIALFMGKEHSLVVGA
jgi:hypothetical protein